MNKYKKNASCFPLNHPSIHLPSTYKVISGVKIKNANLCYNLNTKLNNSLFNRTAEIYLSHLYPGIATCPLGWNKRKWYAVQFIKLLEDHYMLENSPTFYALNLNIAPCYLREICKKELLHPPIYWINCTYPHY